MKKRLLLFIGIIIPMTILSGCWNYTEIDKIAIVSGVAIDKGREGNKFMITAEIVEIQGSLTQGNVKARRIQAEGETLFDAIRNILRISAKKLYWNHTKAVVLSQEVAKEDLIHILDFLSRDNQTRLTLNLFVSREKTAWELFEQQSITTDIRGFEMDYMLISNNNLSKSGAMDMIELIDTISSEGISPYLPSIGITLNDGKKTSELNGIAVFQKDKLLGFLDGSDTKFFLFAKDRIKGGVLMISPEESHQDHKVTLEILNNTTKIRPVYLDEKLTMKINIHTEVVIGENDFLIDYINREGRSQLKAAAEQQLKEDVQNVIHKIQKDFGSDILGFGRIIKAYHPSLWKNIKYQWDELFKTVAVDVHVELDIIGSGINSTPIRVGE